MAEVRLAVAEEGLGGVVAYGGTLDHDAAVRRLARATVYVLPSVDEPFPMGVLEALAVGTRWSARTAAGSPPRCGGTTPRR
ncbi:glycosyltransferase [Streptomyces albulus]|nr:glycosyltransferase [Streptomyces noursei]